MIQKVILVLLSVSLVRCGSSEKINQNFESKINQNNCEEALEAMPENQTGYHVVSKAKQISGTVLSYSATGAAYTVQVLWDVTATVGAVVVLCAPTVALLYVANGHGTENIRDPLCFPGDVKAVQAPYLGKKTYESTENWDCPDVDSVSRSIRKVAQCYTARGGEENRKKALTSLHSVENSGSFYRCLSEEERNSFLKDLQQLI